MDLLFYIAKSALILSIFYATYIVVLRKDTFFTAHRHYFLSGIIAALILPFITFTQTTYIDVPVTVAGEYTEHLISYPIASDAITSEISTPIDWWQIVFIIYGVGILFMGARFIIQLKSLYKLIIKNETVKKEGYTHVKVHKPISPFSFFRHIVYNPDLHNAKELGMIITHEKVHGRQWHTIDMLLTQFLLIIQWINPLAWLYRKSLEQNLEFIADNEAIASVASKTAYQLVLVKCSSAQLQPALTNNFYHSLIKKRIVMLNKQASRKRNLLKLGIVLPLLAIFLYSFNIKRVTAYNEIQDPVGQVEEASAFAKAEQEETVVLPLEKSILGTQPSTQTEVTQRHNSPSSITPRGAVQTLALNNSPVVIASKLHPANQNLNQLPLVNALHTTSPKVNPAIAVAFVDASSFKIKITKNTSDQEFEKIKEELKDKHNVSLDYKASRNSKGEITSLSIKYSSETGSGNMSTNGDEAIEDVIFYRDEDGSVGLLSGSTNEEHLRNHAENLRRQAENLERKARRLQERQVVRVEELQHRMEERRAELEERREERQEHLQERMERIHQEREERHAELAEEREHMREEIEERREEIEAHRAEILEEAKAHVRAQRAQATQAYAQIARRADAQIIVITKDTSVDEIKRIKNRLKGEGFSFTFTKVKRNDRGEITSYKLTFKDNKGTSSTSTHKSSGTPIEPIRIAYADGSISIE